MDEINPFIEPKKPRQRSVAEHIDWEKRRADGRALIVESGLRVGDVATVSWKIDPAYGGGTKSHTGVVVELNDWLCLDGSDRDPGHLKIPISGLHHVHVERVRTEPELATNPFMQLASTPTNPFMI